PLPLTDRTARISGGLVAGSIDERIGEGKPEVRKPQPEGRLRKPEMRWLSGLPLGGVGLFARDGGLDFGKLGRRGLVGRKHCPQTQRSMSELAERRAEIGRRAACASLDPAVCRHDHLKRTCDAVQQLSRSL